MSFLPIALPHDDIEAFCERWDVVELSLFGSILRDDFHNHSDVDFLIAFSLSSDWSLLDHIQMEQELAAIVQREVDLVSKRAIEQSKNPLRRQEILSTARVIYTKAAHVPT